LEINISYNPHKQQKVLHDDSSRYRVVVAGRRFGKSVFARHELIRKALFFKADDTKYVGTTAKFWIVSPTYRQGKEIHWNELKKEIPHQLIKKKNEVELEITLFNDTIIALKGADNPDSLRGSGLEGVVLDEAAFQKKNVWSEIVQPMLIETGGWAVFIGTPKGYNWFYELYKKGDKKQKDYDEEWMSYRFSSYDNPFVPTVEIDKKKEQVSADTFAQEYLAEFTTFEGRIYKNFTPDDHIIRPIEIPFHWKRYGGFDFSGGREPAALVIVAIDPETDVWYVIKELYMKEKASRLMIQEMRAEFGGGFVGNMEQIWCDPHMRQLWEDYKDNQFYMTPAIKVTQTQQKGWVRLGIDVIYTKLNVDPIDGKTGIQIFNTCEKLINEFQMYEWKSSPDDDLSEPGVPIKKNDHGLDALRYFAVSYKKQPHYIHKPMGDKWKIGQRQI